MDKETLKKVEGKGDDCGKEYTGESYPVSEGKPLRFVYREGEKDRIIVTTPVRSVTEKKNRRIIRTENSVYSLEKKEKKE